jgi:hypothetical protein
MFLFKSNKYFQLFCEMLAHGQTIQFAYVEDYKKVIRNNFNLPDEFLTEIKYYREYITNQCYNYLVMVLAKGLKHRFIDKTIIENYLTDTLVEFYRKYHFISILMNPYKFRLSNQLENNSIKAAFELLLEKQSGMVTPLVNPNNEFRFSSLNILKKYNVELPVSAMLRIATYYGSIFDIRKLFQDYSLSKFFINSTHPMSDPHAKPLQGMATIHLAVKHPKILKIIISHFGKEINLNIRNSSGETAIHIAIKENILESIDILFESGADLDLTNFDEGKSARELLIESDISKEKLAM